MKINYKYLSFNIRCFLIKTLLFLTSKLGRLNRFKHYTDYNLSFIFYETKEINLKDLDYTYKSESFKDLNASIDSNCEGCKKKEKGKYYEWESLKKSIKEYGIINPLTVTRTRDKYFKYLAIDGNHRMKVWEHLYGKNSKIKVNIYVDIDYVKYSKALDKHRIKLYKERKEELNKKTYEE